MCFVGCGPPTQSSVLGGGVAYIHCEQDKNLPGGGGGGGVSFSVLCADYSYGICVGFFLHTYAICVHSGTYISRGVGMHVPNYV